MSIAVTSIPIIDTLLMVSALESIGSTCYTRYKHSESSSLNTQRFAPTNLLLYCDRKARITVDGIGYFDMLRHIFAHCWSNVRWRPSLDRIMLLVFSFGLSNTHASVVVCLNYLLQLVKKGLRPQRAEESGPD